MFTKFEERVFEVCRRRERKRKEKERKKKARAREKEKRAKRKRERERERKIEKDGMRETEKDTLYQSFHPHSPLLAEGQPCCNEFWPQPERWAGVPMVEGA